MDAEDTSKLVRDALAGDRDAEERLVALLTPVIQACVARTLLARRASRNVREDVKDLTQDVLLRLFEQDRHVLRSWEPERGLSLENFVGLVSKFYVLSFLRSDKRNRRKEEPVPDKDLEGPSSDRGAEEIVVKREQLHLLLDGMRKELSPEGWHLFELLYVEELSVRETMAVTGLSEDAVYQWRSRLRRLARKLLAELSGNAEPERKTRKDEKEKDEDEKEKDEADE